MTTHLERAARMYGGVPKTAAPVRAKAAPQKSLYDGSGLDRPLASYFDRREAKLRNDAEGLSVARQEWQHLEAFARKLKIKPDDLQTVLAVMHEHDVLPRSQAAIEQRRVRTKEVLRLEHGGAEQADAHLRRYVSVTAALAEEVPTLAARANQTGAGEDPRIINALAAYGEAPTTQEK